MPAPTQEYLDLVAAQMAPCDHRCIHCQITMRFDPADQLLCSSCDRLAYDGVPLSVQMSHDVARIAEVVASGAVIRATVAAVEAIRASDQPKQDLAARFGVSPSLITQVQQRTIWRHI